MSELPVAARSAEARAALLAVWLALLVRCRVAPVVYPARDSAC
jgi:hypothetical protein